MSNLQLQPDEVFKYFELISSVPRGSGNTQAVSELCVDFAKEHNLRYVKDKLNNVVIFKPASDDMKGSKPVILQGHIDMVCAKDNSVVKDMAKEPVELVVEGDYLKAKGTSLGADNGIAVAMTLAILASDTISHPPIEAVFTSDEEVGMLGAAGLDMSILSAKRMINLDSEDEGVFFAGCAGGVRVNCSVPVDRMPFKSASKNYLLKVGGLLGGHSGAHIDKEHANANVLLARSLHEIMKSVDLRLITYAGGKVDNAITDAAEAIIAVADQDDKKLLNAVGTLNGIYRAEYRTSDPKVTLTVEKLSFVHDRDPLNLRSTKSIIDMLFTLPYGVQAMSPDVPGLVETSLNLGITKLNKTSFDLSYAIRSSVESRKNMLVDKVITIVRSYGGDSTLYGDYPGWQYRIDSPLRDLCAETYKKLTGKEPVVQAIHAGLECGLFVSKIDDLDCISTGPNMSDVHTPREKVSISSVKRTYEFVLEVLKNL